MPGNQVAQPSAHFVSYDGVPDGTSDDEADQRRRLRRIFCARSRDPLPVRLVRPDLSLVPFLLLALCLFLRLDLLAGPARPGGLLERRPRGPIGPAQQMNDEVVPAGATPPPNSLGELGPPPHPIAGGQHG